MRSEVLLACSAAPATPMERAALTRLTTAVRRAARSLDVRQVAVGSTLGDALPAPDVPAVAVPVCLSPVVGVVEALQEARRASSCLRLADPLGPDWTLAELAAERLIHAGARKDDAVVLGVPGSDDLDELHAFAQAARLLDAVWGGAVRLGSLRGRGVGLREAVDVARESGRRVVVSAYLLGGGADLAGLRDAGADLVTAPFLDGGPPDARLAALVLTRYEQALGRGSVAVDPGA